MYCRVIPFRICVARWCFEFLPRTSWEKWFPRWGGGRYSSGGKATWVLFHGPPECTHFISCHDGGSLATDFWAALFRVEIQCVKLGVDCRAPAALLCDAFDYWNHGKEDDLRYDERGVRCKLAIHRRSGRNSACKKKSGRVTRKGRGKVHVSWTAGETRGASLLAAGNYATIFYPSDSALLIINFNIFGVAGAFVAEEQFVDPVSLHIWSVDYEK